MFKTSSTDHCSIMATKDGKTLDERCNTGTISCKNCNGLVYCNSCLHIEINGESVVEIYAYHIRSLTCLGGCVVVVNAYRVEHISCLRNCTMIINVFKAMSISCYFNCSATLRVPWGTKEHCPDDDGDCIMTATYHENFTEFCLNSGFGLPVSATTDAYLTTTSAPHTTTEISPETTAAFHSTELATTGI